MPRGRRHAHKRRPHRSSTPPTTPRPSRSSRRPSRPPPTRSRGAAPAPSGPTPWTCSAATPRPSPPTRRSSTETPDWWEAHANLGICHARNGRSRAGRGRLQAGPGGLPRLAGDQGRARRPPARPGQGPARGPQALRGGRGAGAGRDPAPHTPWARRASPSATRRDRPRPTRPCSPSTPRTPTPTWSSASCTSAEGELERAEEHFVESLKADPGQPARPLLLREPLLHRRRPGDGRGDPGAGRRRRRRATPRPSPPWPASGPAAASYGDALDYIERAVEAGESDVEHFRSALEFAPLHADPRFRTLLSRMVHEGRNGQG